MQHATTIQPLQCNTGMVKFSKDHVKHINVVFNEHKLLHFDPTRSRNHRRALKTFRLKFFNNVNKLGGTASAADEVMRMQIEYHVHNKPSDRSLCIMYPFSRGVVKNYKQYELRSTNVSSTLKGKTVFINESTTPTTFTSVKIPSSWKPAPGKVIGTAVCTGGFELDIANLTPEIAKASMLTLEGLKAAVKQGYKYAWTFESGVDFGSHAHIAADASKSGQTAQIVTIMNDTSKPKLLVL